MLGPITTVSTVSDFRRSGTNVRPSAAALGREGEGVIQMRQGIAAFQAAGALLGLPRYYTILTAGCGKIGEIEEGLATLAEGFLTIDKTGGVIGRQSCTGSRGNQRCRPESRVRCLKLRLKQRSGSKKL